MGLMDSLKASCTKMAKQAVKDAMDGGNEESAGGADTRAPEDSEAYAAKVAESIKADVRYVHGYARLALRSPREAAVVVWTSEDLCVC